MLYCSSYINLVFFGIVYIYVLVGVDKNSCHPTYSDCVRWRKTSQLIPMRSIGQDSFEPLRTQLTCCNLFHGSRGLEKLIRILANSDLQLFAIIAKSIVTLWEA